MSFSDTHVTEKWSNATVGDYLAPGFLVDGNFRKQPNLQRCASSDTGTCGCNLNNGVKSCTAHNQALDILRTYTGFPDIPTGRPCGVLAYMMGHGLQEIHLPVHTKPAETVTVKAPFFDPSSKCAPEPYFAVIRTNPAGIWVATLPKGAQDLIATKPGVEKRYELGQPRDLRQYLLALKADGLSADADCLSGNVNALHLKLIDCLLEEGYEVRIEDPVEAAIRETREEHGFDLSAGLEYTRSFEFCVEYALSKRSPDPVAHFLCVIGVTSFDTTRLASSDILEEKNPHMLGNRYREFGTYLTVTDMFSILEDAKRYTMQQCGNRELGLKEIASTNSKLQLLRRIDSRIRRREDATLSEPGNRFSISQSNLNAGASNGLSQLASMNSSLGHLNDCGKQTLR